ncbi:zinc-binding dehydrogenase [Caballeronia novacaledonica]|uniref:Zinc-binding dehydrogenase n=1 Tax=Caballeronia novacaledonica TaxID=1544861 RepID=A0AA37II11_9BURK|nr:zinc-binding dehydrogenase [Caballeronia novacaledonica]GJH30186.1 zinc-binding dehydrogenase [Caballeronia novacaledonica]
MKQMWITGHGGPERLEMREAKDPVAKAGEVRVRVEACGINFADILARRGLYPDSPRPPMVVGYEISGTVDQTGSGVDEQWLGRDVFALVRFGGYADTVTVPASHVFAKPAALDHAHAVALPVQYLTAWQLLVVMGALTPGDSVLIHNAGGGVGLAAIDIARHLGAAIYGTASPGKHAFLLERGLHHAIDYTRGDWKAELMRLTSGAGVELIIDPLGGAHCAKSYSALRPTGRLGIFGISSAAASQLPGLLRLIALAAATRCFHPLGLMSQNRGVFGVNLGHLWDEFPKLQIWMKLLLDGVDEGWIRPHVDRTFPFQDAGNAHAWLEDRRNAGKVVLKVTHV